MSTPSKNNKMDVVIIGGSITGLMHGIMLKSLGHDVRIIEQRNPSFSGDGAGLSMGPSGKRFLQEYDATEIQLGYDSPGFKFLARDNTTISLTTPAPIYVTSWTAFYYRLRGLFDGFRSPFCISPPASPAGHGKVTFETRKRVTGVTPAPDGRLAVSFKTLDSTDRPDDVYFGHLVIDSSGPYSTLRSSLVKERTKYTGYIAWRGTVPESRVSEETQRLFDGRLNISTMTDGNYCIGYAIPGKDGSLELGKRELNWIWYSVVSHDTDLEAILTDRYGHLHSSSVPRGKLNLAEWAQRRDKILLSMNKAFAELVTTTDEPFVARIREGFVLQRAFFDGRLLLVGDGSNLMPPNAGQSTNNAACQCLAMRDMLTGNMTLSEWETSVCEQGWRMRLFTHSIADRLLYGKFWGMVASTRLYLWIKWRQYRSLMKRVVKRRAED